MAHKFRVLARAGGSFCQLGSRLDMRVAPPLKAALLRALSKRRPLTLGATDVERMSTACVQLLVSAGKTFAASGIPFVIKAPSEAFCCAFSDLGLAPTLEQWMSEA